MASKLSESALEVEALRENQKIQLGPKSWMDDAEVNHCPICEKDFTLSRRKVRTIKRISPGLSLTKILLQEVLPKYFFYQKLEHQCRNNDLGSLFFSAFQTKGVENREF